MKKSILILMLLCNLSIFGQVLNRIKTEGNFPIVNFQTEVVDLSNKQNSTLKTMTGNETPATAILITSCITSFTSTNYGAAAEGCGANSNNVDCNNSTGIYGGGVDLSYTVERDIWYKFCPANNGNWTISVTPSNCVLSSGAGSGFQWSVLQGTATNFGWIYFSNGCGNGGCTRGYNSTQTAIINVSNYLNGCIFINIDGYAGNQCNFALTISNASCTLPIELISFTGEKSGNNNILKWSTASEINNEYFVIEKSIDAIDFELVGTESGAGNSMVILEYSMIDNNPYDLTYYRLKQVDIDGDFKYSTIISVEKEKSKIKTLIKITNIIGQEISTDYSGLKIYYYSDGSVIKKIGE
jgi:hypothetical protein